jgi:hypothetical protein
MKIYSKDQTKKTEEEMPKDGLPKSQISKRP